jgi:hypothetical protein
MLTKAEAEARVSKGAAHLDALFPKWAEYIRVNEFDLSAPCSCVLGQLHGDYREAVEDRDIIPRKWWETAVVAYASAEQMGFDAPSSDILAAERKHDYGLLQDAWVDAIAARKFPSSEQPRVTEDGGRGKSTDERVTVDHSR